MTGKSATSIQWSHTSSVTNLRRSKCFKISKTARSKSIGSLIRRSATTMSPNHIARSTLRHVCSSSKIVKGNSVVNSSECNLRSMRSRSVRRSISKSMLAWKQGSSCMWSVSNLTTKISEIKLLLDSKRLWPSWRREMQMRGTVSQRRLPYMTSYLIVTRKHLPNDNCLVRENTPWWTKTRSPLESQSTDSMANRCLISSTKVSQRRSLITRTLVINRLLIGGPSKTATVINQIRSVAGLLIKTRSFGRSQICCS